MKPHERDHRVDPIYIRRHGWWERMYTSCRCRVCGRKYISRYIHKKMLSDRMPVAKQKAQFPVYNFNNYISSGAGMRKTNKHGQLLPDNVRCIMSGPSGSGKTNVLFHLIFEPNSLRFENIYVFSKPLYQPKYEFLKKVLLKEIGYYAYDDNKLVIFPNEAKNNSIVIFDDISTEKHDNIRNDFAMGRHRDLDMFYLGQTYSRIPKQLIRDNCNFVILFKKDNMNLRHIYNDHVTTDMSFEILKHCGLKRGRITTGSW